MATSSAYKVRFRRRVNGKTNYNKRLKYLRSGLPMFVVRFSNRYATVQVVEYGENGDKVIYGAISSILKKYGADGSYRSIPAAYLTGYLVGKKVKGKVVEGIFNAGNIRPTKGGRYYAVLKGIADAGIKVNFDSSVLPGDERINGVHLKHKVDLKSIKSKIESEVLQ